MSNAGESEAYRLCFTAFCCGNFQRWPSGFFLPSATPRRTHSMPFASGGIFGSPRNRTSPGHGPLVHTMAFPNAERGSAQCAVNHVRISSMTGFDSFARRAASVASRSWAA